jgi:3-hydroxyisobutyrate dehydrogenase-like beta-hydroxyacid dehydrogenase
MATIGFIGLGIMGTPMARHLQNAGRSADRDRGIHCIAVVSASAQAGKGLT